MARADVSIGEWEISEGNTIRVLAPHASVDLQQIVDDILDASSSNRYLIQLGPGVYDLGSLQTLVLKEYVDLAGSGENTTEILGHRTSGGGSCGSSAGHGVVALGDNSVLSDLTVTNDSTSSATGYSVCNIPNSSPTFRRVTARTTSDAGGGSRHAFHFDGGAPRLIDITALADNGDSAYGIYCKDSTLDVSRAWLTAINGVSRNRGIWLVGTCLIGIRDLVLFAEDSPLNDGMYGQPGTEITIAQGRITVSGSGANRGIYIYDDAKAVLNDLRVRPSGGSSNTGIELAGDADLRLVRGTVSGSTAGIDSDSTVTAFISQSTIFGGVTGTGTLSCVASDDGQGNELLSDCS